MYHVEKITVEERDRILDKVHDRPLFESKANIHGTCIKLFTDKQEYKDAWRDNFNSMSDFIRPHARVVVIENGRGMHVKYEPTSKTVIIENCEYYGWIKSIALGLVAEFMEDVKSEHRRFSIHGSYVDFGGNGVAIIGPSGSGKTTLTYGLLLESYTNFLTDDWMFVRLANDVLVYSSEKNSYIRGNIEKDWKPYAQKFKKLGKVKKDNMGRSLIDVKMLFGEDRIRETSVMGAVVLLTRQKGLPAFRELDAKEGVDFMMKEDFCNPHQLIRNPKKNWMRKEFFSELFERVPVYLLNTIETPREYVERVLKMIEEE